MGRSLFAFLLIAASLPAQESEAPGGRTLIDAEVASALQKEGMKAASRCEDAEFLRRVHLDIVGTLPAPRDIEAFIADPSSSKRSKIVDDLLAGAAYAGNWSDIWANTLIGHGDNRLNPTVFAAAVLRPMFEKNVPFDELAKAILTSTGSYELKNKAKKGADAPEMEGAAVLLYFRIQKEAGKEFPQALAGRFSRIFLGRQIQCAQCHDHPFDAYTQEDFYGMASFFSQTQVRRKKDEAEMTETYELVDAPANNRKSGDLVIPNSNKPAVPPTFLGTKEKPKEGVARRVEFARFLTADPQFAKAAVNRIWNHFFGRGIVHPFDDFTDRNKPSHPDLISRLAVDFRSHRFDPKWLIREICNSEAYQRSSRTGARDSNQERLLAIAPIRALTPEQILGSLVASCFTDTSMVTDTVRSAILKQFRYAFGDDEGSEIVDFEGSIPAALMLMNGDIVSLATGDTPAKGAKRGAMQGFKGKPGTRIVQILKDHSSDEARVRAVFLSVLCRPPNTGELSRYLRHIKEQGEDGVEDLMWTLLNSSEFLFNH